MQQGSSATGTAGASATSTMTDEQILGLEPADPASRRTGVAQGAVPAPAGTGPEEFLGGDPQETASGPPSRPGWDGAPQATTMRHNGGEPQGTDHTTETRTAAAEPEWLQTLDAQPEAAAEARRWRQAAQDAAALDADYFSADAGARAGLAARLHENDPDAFRAMLADAARLLAERDPQGLAELARQLGAADAASATGRAVKSVAQAARKNASGQARSHDGTYDDDASQNPRVSPTDGAGATRATATSSAAGNSSVAQVGPAGPDRPEAVSGAATFPADTYRAFESATNDDVARQVRDSIDRALTATLPDGIASGARRRIGDDIFHDLNATLSADRQLAAQINDLLRGWRFDASTRQQVAGLLAGRARTALPEVARRVVSEWTSSVLASDRAKHARIESATSRRDITGGRLPEPVASNALRPRPVDYARTSDEQIMEM